VIKMVFFYNFSLSFFPPQKSMEPSETTGDIAGARIIILGKHNEISNFALRSSFA
jgi:hypothetical protein